MDDVKLLTSAEVGAMFRVHPATVNRWATAKPPKIPSVRTPGGHLRFREDEIRPLLQGAAPRSLRAVDAA